MSVLFVWSNISYDGPHSLWTLCTIFIMHLMKFKVYYYQITVGGYNVVKLIAVLKGSVKHVSQQYPQRHVSWNSH